MEDFNILKPFELSYWEDELVKIPKNTSTYLDIYKGLNTDAEDLSFWYFPRQWTETILSQDTNNDNAAIVSIGGTGASQNIETNLSTTTINFKPNTDYTIFMELDFSGQNGQLPSWDNYNIINPNSKNFKIITLTKKIGENSYNNLKTIFDSDIVISFNENGFNLNDSIFSGEDSAVLYQKGTGKNIIGVYCVCSLKTNDFLNEQNTIGLWTTLNCFKTGYWSGKIEIQVVEGKELYEEILENNKVSNNEYLERLNLKNKEEPNSKEAKGLFFEVEGKTNESILYIFQKKIREAVGKIGQGNVLIQNIASNIREDIFNNFFEEITTTRMKYEDRYSSTDFYRNIYGVFNKYFPFIPVYSTSKKEAYYYIKNLLDKNNINSFNKFLSVALNDDANFIKITAAPIGESSDEENLKNNLKRAIALYIQTILENSYLNINSIDKINTNSDYEHLLLQLIVFYLNNNSTIKYIYDLIYKEIDIVCNNQKLELATMNKVNIAAYTIILLLAIDVVDSDETPYDSGGSGNFPREVKEILPNDITQVTLNPLVYNNNHFEVTGNFRIGHRATYILKTITYMGWPRFGYYNGTNTYYSLNKKAGFLLWLNDESYTVDEEVISINNSINFYDLIKLLGQNIILEGNFVKTDTTKLKEEEYYLKDKKIFVFGKNTFTDKSAAQNIQLKRSIKDIPTLTFSLYDSYYDRDSQSFVKNPFVPYLKNESRIRLFYDNNWYDFTITNIQENLVVEHKIDYIAKDSNILELSKVGFNKTFNTELDNNIGNINELVQKTIDGTDWILDEDKTDKIQQWVEQPVFYGYTNKELVAKNIDNLDVTLENNSLIFLFYNEILNEKKDLTILILNNNNNGDTVEELININSTNNILDKVEYYKLKTDFNYNILSNVHYKKPDFIGNDFILLFSTRAKQLICKPKMHYSKPLNRYVYEYKDIEDNNKIYYGYEQHEYSTDSLIINLLPHGQDFINLDNWYVSNSIDSITKTIKSSLDLCITNEDVAIAQTDEGVSEKEIIDGNYSFLTFKTENNYLGSGYTAEYNNPHGFIFNTDLTYNFDKLDSLKVNDEFVLRLQLERGIDKSISSSGQNKYTDDQITLLESLIPCIYSYTSVDKIQSLGLSSATEQDQLIYFWYPTQYNVGSSKILNLTKRAEAGCLVPIYWEPLEAGFGSSSSTKEKGLPVFYTYEEVLSWWTNNSKLIASQTQGSTIKNKKYYLTPKGRKQLCISILQSIKKGSKQSGSFFDYYNFPIVSSLFETKNMLAICRQKYKNDHDNTDGTDDEVINYIVSRNEAATTENFYDSIRIFKEKNDLNVNPDGNYYIWHPDSSLDEKTDIKYYITFNLRKWSDYKACFDFSGKIPQQLEEKEQYLYNNSTNCFEPINITIEGLNNGESSAPGLPLETDKYYNDFEIIMRGRAIWKPVKYSPFGTCIFEAAGKYQGAPKYITNGYSFQSVNYNYGDLLSKNIGLFFLIRPTMYDGNPGSSQLAVSKVEFFRKYEDENGQIISPTDIINANIKTIYSLYDPELLQNKTALKENDILWKSKKYYLENKYQKVIDETGEKVNSITITESNIYNILQKLAEIFNAWLHIDVKHDLVTGETVGIVTDTLGRLNTKPIKTIYFTDADYNKHMNYAGIKYKVNLKNMQRQIDSNDIINKLIVKNNNNEYGELGFCSIMNSDLNVSGSNNVFNFDYYINNKILNGAEIYHLLYDIIYPRTYVIGQSLLQISKNKNEVKIKINQIQADVDFYKVGCDNIESEISNYTASFYEITGIDYSLYVANPNTNNINHPLYIYRENLQILGYIRKLEYYTKLLITYKNHLTNSERKLLQLQEQFTLYQQQIIGLIYQRDYLLNQFYNVYSSYIKEGSWISEDYIDDDLYYMDAEKKLEESSKPKITYNIEVIDISNLPEFAGYTFNLYDKTYIEDPEIFGYNKNGTPYQEEITVSELTNYLQSPEKNTITVQNYKTQFDDLFQRMTSTIQAVEFGTGNYTNVNNSLLKNKILNNEI